MTGVESIRQCTPQEHDAWVRHQRSLNPNTGDWLLALYRSSPALGRTEVIGAEPIAGLTSFFKRSDGHAGAPLRLTIREALELFKTQAQAADPDGAERYRKVGEYLGRTSEPGSAPVVTAVAFSDTIVLVDGNHPAMAAYLRAAASEPEHYVLPVFVLKTELPSAVLE
jgi:hypothetical protein